jgi:altronate dehydratase large subunit
MTPTPIEFAGYLRADGRVGVRNHLLVLSVGHLTGPTARRIGRTLPDARVVAMPYGSGLVGEDRALQVRSIIGLGQHPNVGAVLMIGADGPKLKMLHEAIGKSGQTITTLCLDDHGHDALTLSDRGLREGARLLREISRHRRTSVPASALLLGVECGRSDPSSGIVANPLIGRVVDTLVELGGRALFGETMEWLGAEHLLRARGRSPQIGQALVDAVVRRERLAVTHGLDLMGNNPNPTNIAAGLSTIEEKSLGSIAKSGSQPIESVVAIGDPIDRPGLHAMDAPSFSPESLTGFVASGAQLMLFSTGVGNSYVSALAPTIKLSANPEACRALAEQLDFDASEVTRGRVSPEDAARDLLALCMEIASGTLTWGEVLDEGDEVVSRLGEAL